MYLKPVNSLFEYNSDNVWKPLSILLSTDGHVPNVIFGRASDDPLRHLLGLISTKLGENSFETILNWF